MAASPSSGVRVAILAGGRGARLGGAKALVELAGRPLVSYPLAAARDAGLEPLVVAKPESQLPELDCELIREPAEPRHPLAGAIAALRSAAGPVIVLGCDMPFVTGELLDWLARADPPAAARVHGRLQPLLGLYEQTAEPVFADAVAANAPAREAVERLDLRLIDEGELRPFGDPARLTFSVNTPGDLAEAERLLAA